MLNTQHQPEAPARAYSVPRWRFGLVSIVLLIAPILHAQDRPEPLVEKVQKSIANGVRYLQSQQKANGSWESGHEKLALYEGGTSALAFLSLLNSGVPKDHPSITKGLRYLRENASTYTYVRALQTMALAEAGFPEDRQLIQNNVQWLLDARILANGSLQGWSYHKTSNTGLTDNSNTQYALLGLWAGRQAGIEIPREVWESIRDLYTAGQSKEGTWLYDKRNTFTEKEASLTMTTAGLSGLIIANIELNQGREAWQPNGSATGCGVYPGLPAILTTQHWLGKHFQVGPPGRTYYHLYGLERVGRLSGERFLGEHDWYREGCEYLTKFQGPAGAWEPGQAFDSYHPIVNTSFALLFLSKGRTPILISKIVHGDWQAGGRDENDNDWNNDRNDLRRLVPFVSKELYKNLPLGWQSFDLMRAVNAHPEFKGALTEDQRADLTSDMLQAPIAYITGHRRPRFTGIEKDLLKRYVENGGFILAEACCGSPTFDQGFKQLVAELWPEYDLQPLDPSHPVWTTHFPTPPGDPYKLLGLSMGCKTVLIYSPQDLSCQWESAKIDPENLAFRIGTNIVAYATGREPPRPRLTQVQVATNRPDTPPTKAGYFKVGQLKFGIDSQPAPKAMRNLLDRVNQAQGLDVQLRVDRLPIADSGVIQFKFLYMHGRNEFKIPASNLENLRFTLETGGLLFADACCGKESFDKSFRQFAQDLFPNQKLERVPPGDDLFSAKQTGIALSNLRCRTKLNGPLQAVEPYLEGIKLDGRWVVLYSKYDLGCALERNQSSDCLGYDHDSAMKLASAVVLYNLRP